MLLKCLSSPRKYATGQLVNLIVPNDGATIVVAMEDGLALLQRVDLRKRLLLRSKLVLARFAALRGHKRLVDIGVVRLGGQETLGECCNVLLGIHSSCSLFLVIPGRRRPSRSRS